MSTSEQCLMTEEPALTMPGGAFIDGVWQRDDLTVPVIDPEDGRLLAYVADSSPADVAAAVSGVHDVGVERGLALVGAQREPS